MYGVAFTQSSDNNLYGILLFNKQAKANLVYRILCGMESKSSLEPNLNTVLEISDYNEIPEIEDMPSENAVIEVEVEGQKRTVFLVNHSVDDEIPDIE